MQIWIDDDLMVVAAGGDVGAPPGQTARDLFELQRPEIDWLRVAGSMGVEAARAETLENLADLLRGAFTRKGPFLIELTL